MGFMKEYRLMQAAVELVDDRKARAKTSLQTDGCDPQRPPVKQPKPRCGSFKWVLEDNTAYYGQEEKSAQYSSLSLSLLISHTRQKHRE